MAYILLHLSRCHADLGAAERLSTSQPFLRPNVLLIISDDQGYGDLACHGNPKVRTPHLDQLYAESIRFTDFHVDPTCSPTRAALMTGRYSTRSGVCHTIMGRSILHRDEVTLPEVFQANGYRTGIFGKWHLGDNFPSRPQDRGFQQTLILGGGGIGQTPDYWGNDYFDDRYCSNGSWQAFSGYCTDVFFEETRKFIEQSDEVPFFAYLATNVPHGPYYVPDQYRQRYLAAGLPQRLAAFYGMIENLDENVGRLLKWLEDTGRADNTIVVFMTDNGSSEGAGPALPKNGPLPAPGHPAAAATGLLDKDRAGFSAGLRALKGSPYDGGHRVPLFLRWPGGELEGGRDLDQLTAHFDLLPTLVDLCQLQFEPRHELDGRSLVPLLRGDNSQWPQRTLFVHTQRTEIPRQWTQSAVLTDRWRLINGHELYRIQQDRGQQHDVGSEHLETVAQLRAEYEQWWSSLAPALDRFSPIVVGDEREPRSRLTCMDWHAPDDQIPWDQQHIRRLPVANGWWLIEMKQPGTYRFTLRHQPTEALFPLVADRGRITVGDVVGEARVAESATAVTITLDLPAGEQRLVTELIDTSSGVTRGAFFVEVERVADSVP